MKLYSFLLWLCCLLVAFVQPLTAQTTVDFEGVKFDPISGFGVGYGKAFGVVESDDDEDELTLAGGFVFAITTTHSLTTIVSASGEGYNSSACLATNGYDPNFITGWSIKKSDDTNFQFKGIFLKDTGYGGSANGTVTAYKGGVKIGNSVEVDFDGTLNQSFVANSDFYDIDEVRIEAEDLDIYLDQFMAGPPYSTNANASAHVSSIVVDGSPNSSATTMNFLVTFDKPVTNVTVNDFMMTGIGAMGEVGDITPVSTTVYRVTIALITGEGTIKLNLKGGTDIATINGNIAGTPPFTAGESHVVGPCSIENFDQGESDNAASFSNNGQTYQLSGNWKVRKFSPVRGINGSGFHLSGTGQDPMVWKVSAYAFKVGSFNLFLSDNTSGNTLATNGTVTITGKRAGTLVFTQIKNAEFNTDPSVNNGYTFIDLGSDASAVIDELEIQLGGSFQYVDLDNISLCTVFNNPAVIDNLNGNVVNFIEDSVPVLLDANSDATVTDLDSPNFSGGNMRVAITANRVSDEDVLFIRDQGTGAGQIGVSGSNVTYGGVVIGTWTGGTGTDDLVISFNVNSGPASAEALIRNLTYWNSNTIDPATAARTIAVTLNDGDGGTSTPAKVTVQIKAVNDAPTVVTTAVNPTFTEDGAAVSLFSGTAISTIEAGQAISKLVFTVANVSDGNQEILTIDGSDVPLVSGTQTTGTNGLTVNVSVSGVSTTVGIGKSGGLSPAIMAGIVDGITYRNTSTNPNITNRVITLSSIQDNGGTANGGTEVTSLSIASTITIVAVNDAPVVTTSGGNTTYTEGTAVVVDDALTVSDPDNTTLASATVAIRGNFQSGEDILSFTSDGTTMGNITTALYNKATGVLTLSSAGATATVAQWQAALRAVKYDNLSQNPSTAARTISFTVSDGDLESIAATKMVSVIAINDAPVAVDDYVTLTEDIPATGNVLTNDSDPEGNALTASLVISPVNGTVVLNADGSFTYTPKANYAGRDSLQYQVCDNGVPSKCGTAWLYLTVNPVNDAPIVTVPLSIAVTEDIPSALTGISFSDVDAGANPVTVTFSVPSGTLRATSGAGVTVGGTVGVLTLNGSISDINTFVAAGAITFTTASNATSNVTLTVSINDNGHTGGTALSDTKTIALVVTAVNDAPVNSVPGAQSVDQNTTLVFSAANSNQISVSDVDAGANAVQITLTATNGLITLSGTSGLNVSPGDGINVASMTLTGTIVAINNALNGLIFEPTPGYNGPASLQIATDDLGNTGSGGAQTATNTIAITVKPIIPTVVSVGASTADGTYKIGDDITLVVTFDQQVIVNTTGGVPGLLLETGAVDREATYLNGNGSKYLIFSYTVQEGDTAPDLDYQSTTALSLNGATIKNSGGNDAVLTLPTVGGPNSIAGQHAIGIDGVRPTAIMISFSQNVLTIGNTATVTITFSEPVTGLNLNNFALNNGTLSNLSTADNTVYTATLTPPVGVNSEGNSIGLDLNNVSDIAGNLGQGVVSSVIYDVHTVKPETPVAPKLSPDNDTGISREDNITNKTALGFIVDNPEGRNHNDFWNLYAFFVDGVPHSIASITTFSNANFIATLSSLTEGTHTIKTKYYDKYGNESDFSEELEVTIDLTPPIGNLSINNGAVYTNSDDVSLSFTSNEVVSHMKLSNEGNIWSGWIPFEATKQWTLFSEDGTREVYFRLQDVAGNISTIYSSHIILDTKPPIVDGVEDGKTYNTDRTITFNEGSATLNGAAFTSGTVVSAEGRYTLVVTDDAGNTTTVEFEIDKTPPAVPVNFTAIGQNGQVSLLWESNIEADLAKYILYVKRDDGSSLYVAELLKGTENFGYTGLPNGKTFEFVLIAVDQVGNRSAEALASAKTMSEQTISFATLGNLTYGQQALALTASATSQLPVSFVSSDSNIAEVYQDNNDGGKWKVDAKKVGKVTITAAQAGNNEYLPAVSVNQLLTIVPASLTVTADAKTKVYGDADPALTYTVKASDLRNGDAVSVVGGTLTRAVGESVGSYDITNVDLAADNYTINYVKSTLSITKANLTVTADAKTKVYGGADPALTYTVKASDLRNGDAVSVVGGTLTRAVGESVGSYDITNVDLAADNYTINYVKSQLSITKANLTVTADAKTKVYGGVDPALTYTVKASDLRNGDDASVVTGSITRVAGEDVGDYDITNVDLAADNYTVNYEQSTLSITKANLTVTADAKTKVYGGADPALTYTVKASDLRNGDDASVVTGSITRVAGEDVGDYDINNVNLLASNYNIQYEKAQFLITKASIAGVTFADASFTYDGTVKSLVIAGTLPVGAQVSYENNEQTEAGEYTVTAVIDGGNNYVGERKSAKLTIEKAALPMFTFADASFTYDGTVKSLIATGLPAGTTVGSYENNEQTEAGEYEVKAIIDGGRNYENGSQTAKLTITKAALPMFTFADGSFVYDGTIKSLIATGLPAGTTVGSYENNEQTEAGEYVVKAIIDGGNNYENGSQTAKLTIEKASIAGVTFADASFTYDGTVKSLVIAGALPVGTQVSYQNNEQTEAGEYTVTASIDGGNNYVGERKSAKLTITKAVLPAFIFADASFVYDGTVKSLVITNLPAGLTATYSNNDHIDAGEYTVTAKVDGGKNYTGTVTKTAKLRISPLQQVLNFAPISAQYRDAGTVQLDITSNSDLPIQVFSDNLLVAEVQGASELLIKGVGRSVIRVEQAGDPNHVAAKAVEQLLEVLNEKGAKLPVRVHPAVSPNGDGINEFLRIEGIEYYPENKLVIFDGNGNVVQSFDKYDNHSNYFDGTKAGRPVPNGTYFYMLEVKVNGKWEHDKGYFVIRK